MADDGSDTVMTDEAIDAIVAEPPPEPAAQAAAAPVEAQPAVEAPPVQGGGEPPAAGTEPPPEPPGQPGTEPPPADKDGQQANGGKWDGLSQVGQLPKRLYTTHLNEVQKETIRLMAVMPNLDPAEVAALAKRNLGIEQAPASPNGQAPAGQNGNGAAPANGNEPQPVLDPIEKLAAELDEVEGKLNEAAELDGVGTTFNREVKDLLDRRQELRSQIETQRREKNILASIEQDRFDRANQASIEDAQAAYPDLQNEESPLHKAVIERFREVEGLKKAIAADPSMLRNPDVSLRVSQWNHPNFPRMLADEVAREMGVASAPKAGSANGKATSQQGSAPAQNGSTPTPKAGPVPVPGSFGAAHRVNVIEASAMDRFRAAAKQAVESDDLDVFDKALDQIPDGVGVANSNGAGNGRVMFVR